MYICLPQGWELWGSTIEVLALSWQDFKGEVCGFNSHVDLYGSSNHHPDLFGIAPVFLENPPSWPICKDTVFEYKVSVSSCQRHHHSISVIIIITNIIIVFFIIIIIVNSITYCAFHKHANSKVQKLPSQLRFSLPSIIITITSNEPWNTETHKTDRNPPITNHKPWPFEPVKVKFCFLRGPLRWLTAVKNAIVSWLLNLEFACLWKAQ